MLNENVTPEQVCRGAVVNAGCRAGAARDACSRGAGGRKPAKGDRTTAVLPSLLDGGPGPGAGWPEARGLLFRVGVDIGGTFTDIVFLDASGRLHTKKVSSSVDDYARAIIDGL